MKRSTLVVIAIFAVLLIAVVLVNDRPVERGRQQLSYADVTLDDLDGLLIQSTEEGELSTIELAKTDGVWRLADGHMADPDAVQRALEALSSVETAEVISTSTERQKVYGVDAESGLTVEASAGSRTPIKLVVGNPGEGGAYVRAVGDDTIFLSQKAVRHLFPTDAKRWLKLKLVDGSLEEAQRLQVRLASGSAYDLVPTAEGQEWILADPSQLPEGFRFDGNAARGLVSTVLATRAKEIVEPSDELDTGLDGEHDTISLISSVGTSTVHLGADSDGNNVYAAVDGRDALFLVPAYQARNLRRELAELRDLSLMDVASDQVNGLRVKHGSQSYHFTKNETGLWEIAPDGEQAPEGFAYDPRSVDRLVQTVSGIRGAALVEDQSPTAAGLDSPNPSVELSLADASTVTLRFGRSTKTEDGRTQFFASGNADDRVYTVPEHLRDRFTRGWDNFEVVEPPPNMGGNNPLANLDPETLKNLPPEVRESLMKQMQEQAQKQRLMEQIRQNQKQ